MVKKQPLKDSEKKAIALHLSHPIKATKQKYTHQIELKYRVAL
jgi:hypothetical protein